MPSNPVEEAHEDYINRRVAFAEENWRTYLNEKPILISGARAHEISYSFGVLVGQDFVREQERSRYEGLLTLVLDALRENITTWITVHPLLNEPYPDAPRWTPWTQFGKRAADRAVEAQAAIRAVLYAAPPATPSAPAEKEG